MENMNSLASIFIDFRDGFYRIGLSVLESPSRGGWFCEISSDASHPYSAIDKLLHLLFVADVDRVVIGYASKSYYDDLADNFITFDISLDSSTIDEDEQNSLFASFFSIKSLLKPIEHLDLDSLPLASMALALLIKNSSRLYSKNYLLPRFLDISNAIKLVNNPLEQIDFISHNKRELSIFNFLTKPSTLIGKRLMRYRLLLPIDDVAILNARLDLASAVMEHTAFIRDRLVALEGIELDWHSIYCGDMSPLSSLLDKITKLLEIQNHIKHYKLDIDLDDVLIDEHFLIELKNSLHLREYRYDIESFMQVLMDWIAQIDVAVVTAIDARLHNLNRATLIDSSDNFLQINGIRHLLIEYVNKEYISNDLVLGNRDYLDLPYPNSVLNALEVHDGHQIDGVLLYGLNASGKSSLMKSIAIAVVMAQSGFFVPAKSMRFRVFDALFTRVSSKDKISSSLSTFGVEMLELNSIFSKATSKSLVIADEISHGTETLSAVSIVASAILELSSKGVMFFMTTHLHQLSQVKELHMAKNVASLHLGYGDGGFDRALRAGRGESIYGLEFATSLGMDEEFLKNAHRIRDYLSRENQVLELSHKKEFNRRFRDLYLCECVICSKPIEHKAQSQRDEISLCDRHLEDITRGKIKLDGFDITSGGVVLRYEKVLV